MTIPSETARNDYTGNGAADTYSYGFKIFAQTDLVVTQRDTDDVETTLTVDVDYTVTGVGNTAGGTIVLTGGNLPSSYLLTIRRDRPLTQETDVRNQGEYFPEAIEDSFDSIIMVVQTLQVLLDRAMILRETVVGVSVLLPIPEANKVLRWDDSATAIENIDPGSAVLAIPADESVTAAKIDVDDIVAIAAKLAVLKLSGGTMTGAIVLSGDGTLALHAIPAQQIQKGSLTYILTTGAADVYVATFAPALAALTTGMVLSVKIHAANATTTPTINPSTLGATTIKRIGGAALNVGDLPINHFAHLQYDGTDLILLNPALHTHRDTGNGGILTGPCFSVHKNGTDQTITTNTSTKLTWSTELFDTNSDFASDRFTPTVAGKYILTGTVVFTDIADGNRMQFSVYKNGAIDKTAAVKAAGVNQDGVTIAVVVDANGSTDYFELYIWHNKGSDADIDGGAMDSFFTGAKVGG